MMMAVMIIWCSIPFQNIEVIADALQVGKLRFQLIERSLILCFLFFQPVLFSGKILQHRQLSAKRCVHCLRVFVILNLLPMLLIEFG